MLPVFTKKITEIFNETIIEITLKPYKHQENQNSNKKISSWEVVNLTSNEMMIQVNFTDPSLISPKIAEEDKIAIVFMDGELLKNSNGQKYLTHNYTLETGLPRQIIHT